MNIKKIIFILPGVETVPIGGYKIVYEYANRLFEAGYIIQIFYPYIMRIPELSNWNNKKDSKYLFFKKLHYFYYLIKNKDVGASWFPLNKNIKKKYIFEINKKTIRNNNNTIYFATAITTAYLLNKCNLSQNKCFYLVQDFENWLGVTNQQVFDSYKFPMNKIAISTWLYNQIKSVDGEKNLILIQNGLDFDYFKLNCDIKTRKRTEISMLYHLDDRKRCIDAINALKIVKKTFPELHVTMFGTPDKPSDVPDYFDYYKRPDKETHNKIYNNSAIFVAASKAEGFGLTPAESMICGCALCCTDIEGFKEFAKNNETALTSPVYDVNALANNIIKLITNDNLRIQIATNGNTLIKQFSWEKKVKQFIKYIEEKSIK